MTSVSVTMPTVHVVFSDSAPCLESALRGAGRADRVACYPDNLALGPIDPPDHQTRLAWMDREFGAINRSELPPDPAEFWSETLRGGTRKIAWLSRRSAPGYSVFLEWLWRLGDAPYEVVDLTDMPVGNRRRALLLGLLDTEEIVGNSLWDRAKPLDAAARERYHRLWAQLRSENAPLRVVNADGLQSAPITFFDAHLLSFASSTWQKAVRLVGGVMVEWVGGPEPFFQAGDGILAARIPVLVEQGRLEGRGDLHDMRASEVRLPAR